MKESMENLAQNASFEEMRERDVLIEKYGDGFEEFVQNLDKPASIITESTAYEQRNKRKKDDFDMVTLAETKVDIVFETDDGKEIVSVEQETDGYDEESEHVSPTAIQIAKIVREKGIPQKIVYAFTEEKLKGAKDEDTLEQIGYENVMTEMDYDDVEPFVRDAVMNIIRQKKEDLTEDEVKEIYASLYEG